MVIRAVQKNKAGKRTESVCVCEIESRKEKRKYLWLCRESGDNSQP